MKKYEKAWSFGCRLNAVAKLNFLFDWWMYKFEGKKKNQIMGFIFLKMGILVWINESHHASKFSYLSYDLFLFMVKLCLVFMVSFVPPS